MTTFIMAATIIFLCYRLWSVQNSNDSVSSPSPAAPRRQVVKSIKLIEVTPTRKVIKKITPLNRRNVIISIDGRKINN